MLISAIVTGVLLGGLYALLGLGLSLIYGIMKIVNIAMGDFTILAAYLIMFFSNRILGGNLILSFLITQFIMIIIGFMVQKFLINPVAGKSAEAPLLLTFGVAVIIENSLNGIFSSDVQSINNPLASINLINGTHIKISASYALIFVLSVLLVIILTMLIHGTRGGRAIRATSQNAMVAELLGVNTKRMFTIVMCIAMVMVCISGLLLGQTFAFNPYSGNSYLVIAMGVVIIGGMGSLIGTLLGGMTLGIAQLLGGYFLGAGYQTFVGYAVMLILLCCRPQGLVPTRQRQ